MAICAKTSAQIARELLFCAEMREFEPQYVPKSVRRLLVNCDFIANWCHRECVYSSEFAFFGKQECTIHFRIAMSIRKIPKNANCDEYTQVFSSQFAFFGAQAARAYVFRRFPAFFGAA